MGERLEPGTRCRYRRRGDLLDESLLRDVVEVVRPHPLLASMCEVKARDGWTAWVSWEDLYPLKTEPDHG